MKALKIFLLVVVGGIIGGFMGMGAVPFALSLLQDDFKTTTSVVCSEATFIVRESSNGSIMRIERPMLIPGVNETQTVISNMRKTPGTPLEIFCDGYNATIVGMGDPVTFKANFSDSQI